MKKVVYASRIIAREGYYTGSKWTPASVLGADGIPALTRQFAASVSGSTSAGEDINAVLYLTPSVGPIVSPRFFAVPTATVSAPTSGTSVVSIKVGNTTVASKTFNEESWYPSAGNVFQIPLQTGVLSIGKSSVVTISITNGDGVNSPPMLVFMEGELTKSQ